jgi:two-component system CheB/CheR fusion protein
VGDNGNARPRGQQDGSSAVEDGVASPTPGGIRAAPVVAIGASAGGLDALKRLLGALSRDAKLAVVVVQHLSPTHESQLTSVLHAASPLGVVEVQDGMPVVAGRVHVIPPATALALEGDRLRLQRRDGSARPPMPIDTFMRSVAAERKAGAIGVVLSGTGSDGTQGLKAIRAAGGRTYAQEPSTAVHDGMPQSAIAADVVDLILPPEAIAADLTAIARGSPAPSEGELARGEDATAAFRHILHLLKVRNGVDVTRYKQTTLQRRIARRMALVRTTDLAEYLRRLREDPGEVDALHEDLFIHVTSFFRDPAVFTALEEIVFPTLLERRANDAPLRIWAPGCSTGEETYSLAIAALEFLEARGSGVSLQVFGSDISERAIRRARTEEYVPEIAKHVSPERLERFFEQTSKGYRISRRVREACVFVRHDLTADPPFSRIDLLSCRNVLIYFDAVLQRHVVPLFHYALNEPGFLVLGRTEALTGYGELFAIVDQEHKMYARRSGAARVRSVPSGVAAAVERGIHPATVPTARTQEAHRALDHHLLSRYAPAAVLVNDALEIVQVRGKTGPYLEPAPGTASLSLLKYVSSVIEQYAVTNQALADSNEELQATNEELESANEELETAKEELQSTNEELTTVNDELQARYQEVNELSNDLQNLVTSADIPIVIVDRERNVRRFTPKARSAFNLLPTDLGRAIAEIRPNVDAPELDAWIAEVIETTTVKEVEVRDRSGRWQRLQIRPYQTGDKRIDGAVVSLVDVDVLKGAVSEARRARDFATATLETVPVPVVVLDEALHVTSANEAFYQVFRTSPGGTRGRSLRDLEGGPWRSADLAGRLGVALERGVPFQDLELECDLPDDGHRIALMSGRVIPEAPGESRSLVLAVHDVTELRRIEEERARARSEDAQRFLNEAGAAMLPESLDYDATLAALAQLVVPRLADWCLVDLVEAGGVIRQAAAAHVDAVKEQRVRMLHRQCPPEAQPERGVAWVIRTGSPVLFPELDDVEWLAGALGAEHPELLRELGARSYISVPLRGRKGVIGAISLVRGVPGRRYTQEDLAVAEGLGQRAGLAVENARLYLAAREAVVARDDFLAIAAHELRTPLSTLNLQLQTLAAARGPELVESVAAGRLERAIKQTRRLASLIDSLLEVSRITAGKLTLHPEATDLSAIVRDVAQRLRAAAADAGCAVAVDAERPVTGTWDPLRLDQVVTNLIQNAIRYAPASPIEVSVVQVSARQARLAVRDHGPGIPPERRARIFDRFEKGTAPSQEGLGLGLYITRQIVEAHGGEVHVECEAGNGTSFVVELPRGDPPEEGPREPS